MMRKPVPEDGISSPAALALFDTLVAKLKRSKALTEQTMVLVNNMVLLEHLKQEHRADIAKRGVVELFEQGSQSMHRQNPSVAAIVRIVEQQRKLQAELKLTPAAAKQPAKGGGKDEFTDY